MDISNQVLNEFSANMSKNNMLNCMNVNRIFDFLCFRFMRLTRNMFIPFYTISKAKCYTIEELKLQCAEASQILKT